MSSLFCSFSFRTQFIACLSQVKIFGGYTSWAMDLPPPDSSTPLKHFVTTIDSAFRHSLGPISGPVHLNCQYREPLSPKHVPWDSKLLKVMFFFEVYLYWYSVVRFWECFKVVKSGFLLIIRTFGCFNLREGYCWNCKHFGQGKYFTFVWSYHCVNVDLRSVISV